MKTESEILHMLKTCKEQEIKSEEKALEREAEGNMDGYTYHHRQAGMYKTWQNALNWSMELEA